MTEAAHSQEKLGSGWPRSLDAVRVHWVRALKLRLRPLTTNPRFYLVLAADILLFFLAHFVAYLLRFDFRTFPFFQMTNANVFFALISGKVFVFWLFGLYQGMWRYAGVAELVRLFKAAVFTTVCAMTALLLFNRFQGFSRAVFLLDGVLTLFFAGGLRFGIRRYFERNGNGRAAQLRKKPMERRPVFIIGAGYTGEKTVREVLENTSLPFRPVGFIDDDPQKHGRSIHDVPVLCGVDGLGQAAEDFEVREVLIAAPSANGAQMRRIVEACESLEITYKTLPGWGELIDGKVSIKKLRDVDYRDLLRRAPVELETGAIADYVTGKVVLVTGAGGSIGSELCRQISRFQPANLILLDACEANLYNIQMELAGVMPELLCIPVLADIQNRGLMDRIFRTYRPEVVFHAAAYKHVPMMEVNPWQAVLNNVRGSQNVMDLSVAHGVGHFVLISTDKAVRPTNVMGATKRVCELILQAHFGGATRMMAVRFGNVLASSGSVIPLFRRQIAAGGPVTVTHPEVTRYFMTIPEATQLVLQAGAQGAGGELFILNMGTPVKIAEMARDLIRFSGKEPDVDIPVVFTGLRPGEKLYEELITEGEGIVETRHEKIMVLRPDEQNGGGGLQKALHRDALYAKLENLFRLAGRQDTCGIKSALSELVPEYHCQDRSCVLDKKTAPAAATDPRNSPRKKKNYRPAPARPGQTVRNSLHHTV
jgi:FlaA1/EpsC-like NDP-sugar epimerase